MAEAVGPVASVVKPQSAFYERFGSRGIAVLERVVATCREAGALVLLDMKRGDIGSTSQAYADAYLDPASPIAVDAITVSPYLGFGSLDPFVEVARRHDAGLFVLALTSNKEGPEVQHATTQDGRAVGGLMLDHLRGLNAGAEPLGSFGAVVGATIGDVGESFGINGPILAPGYGAQGGTPADLRRIFGAAAGHVLASVARPAAARSRANQAGARSRRPDRDRGRRGQHLPRHGGAAAAGMDRATADYMGMLATVLNALPLQDALEKLGVAHARAVGDHDRRGRRALHPPARDAPPGEGPGRDLRGRHRQPVLHHRHRRGAAGGRDPRRGDPDGQERGGGRLHRRPARRTPTREFIPEITHMEALQRRLRVMDATALTLCMENRLPIHVFNMDDERNIDRIVSGERVGTLVHDERA